MKICKKCGTLNKDENNFCNSCGTPEFSDTTAVQPVIPVYASEGGKDDFTWYDVSTILSFVSALIGFFVIPFILDPLALATGIAGFSRGRRNRVLAIVAVVAALINLLVRLFLALHDNGLIPEWFITGMFD